MASYKNKTESQLINEIEYLQKRVKELEESEVEFNLAKKKLNKQEEQLRAVLDNAAIHIWAFDGECYHYLNKEWYRYTGQDPSLPLTIERWTEVVHPDDLDEAVKTWFKAWECKGVYDGYFRLRSDKGKYRRFHSHSVPVYDEKGNLLHYQGYNVDITERKQAEDSLFKSDNNLRTLFNAMTDVVFEMDYDGRYINIAPTSPELLYKPSDEIIGKTLHEVFPKSEADKFLEFIRKCLDKNKINIIEYPLIIKGKTIWFEGRATPKTKNSVLYIARDITERKQAEDKSRQQQEQILAIFNGMDEVVYVADPKTYELLYMNKPAKENWGCRIGEKCHKVLQNRDTPCPFCSNDEIFGENLGKTYIWEFQNQVNKHWYRCIDRAIRWPKEKMVRFELAIDITEPKRAEQIQKVLYNISNAVITTDNLEELIILIKEQLGTIIDTTNFYITLYDKETDTISLPFITDEKDKFTSFPAGKTLTAYVIKTKNSLLATKDVLKKLEQSGEIETIGSDSKIWLGVPLKIEGELTGVLAVQSYTDENAYDESDMEMLEFISDHISISIDRKKAENDLIAALKKAEESDRLKSAFLANMSHEIRTPMNGILGFTNLLKEPELTGEKKKKYIKIIENSGERMLNIINDLIDISKVETGQMEVSISETNVNEQIEYVYTFFIPEVEKKGIQLFFKNTLPTQEAIIKTDREKIYAILTNLIKNAIKYSNDGTIEFGYEKKGKYLEFFVIDTGIGIPKDRQQAIFDRFVQAYVEDKRAFEGVGLGLSISKAYVEMLGGKIWVESKEGKGSQFYFTIPYNYNTKEISTTKNEVSETKLMSQLKNLTILIVEDNETADTYISIIVKNISKRVLHAKTGTEAVVLCRKNPDIDLILMDIRMPEMNGYEATRQIREFNKDVVIIAQTAYALSGDRKKALESGCDDYISKPIYKDKLIELIGKYLNKKSVHCGKKINRKGLIRIRKERK